MVVTCSTETDHRPFSTTDTIFPGCQVKQILRYTIAKLSSSFINFAPGL